MNRFQIKTAIYYGPGSLQYLAQVAGPVLVVTDPFLATSDVMAKVEAQLAGRPFHVFSRVAPNPTIEVVADGFQAFLEAAPNTLIAVGGGSSIDTAKAVHQIALAQGRGAVEFIVVPTTSGSGSEMTSYAVITNHETASKMALTSEDMYPQVAILDPELVVSTPPRLTADAGFDAVTHAVEAYVARQHTDCSDAMAEKALHLLFEYLPITYAEGENLYARERVHNAACLAGMAFENAGLGICHSLAHAIGGSFPVAHGRLNALILPTVMEFNAGDLRVTAQPGATGLRYAQLGRMLGATGPSARNQIFGLIAIVRHLRRELDLPERVADAGIAPSEFAAAIPDLARTALADHCTKDNPRDVEVADLERLLQRLL